MEITVTPEVANAVDAAVSGANSAIIRQALAITGIGMLGFFIGVGMSFTSIVFISTVLTNWFTKKTGFAIGAA